MNEPTNKTRQNLLTLILALVGVLAGGSAGKAATQANIDFSTGYTAGNLVGVNGWAAYGANASAPIQVSSTGVALAGTTTPQSAFKSYTPYQFVEAGGKVFIRVDINVSTASATGADFFLVTREIDNSGAATQGQPVGKSYFRTYIKSSGAGFVLGWNPHTDTAVPTPPIYDTTVLNFNQTHTILIRCDSFTGRNNDKTYLYVNPSYASDPTTLTPLLSRTTWTGNTDEFSYNVSSGTSGTPLTARLGGFLNLVVKQQTGNALTVTKLMVGDSMTDVGYVAPVTGAVNYTNTATTGASTWTTSADWAPSVPSSATNSALIFNGALSPALTVDNNTAGNFALNSLNFANTGTGTINLTGNPLKFSSMGTTNPTITFVNNTTLIQRVSNALQLDAALTVSQPGGSVSNSIIDGVVSGVAGLTKSGSGYLYLTSGNNSFGGGVTIGNGTLVVENIGMAGLESSLGTNGAINLGGGSLAGTLRWGSGSVTNEATDKSFALLGSTGGGTIEVRGTTSLLTLNGAIDTGANASTRLLTLTGQGGCTVNGEISGNAGLRVNGGESRTVILANENNSFGGPVTIDGGTASKSIRVLVSKIGNAGATSPLGTNGTIYFGTNVAANNFLVWSNTVSETTDKTIAMAGTTGLALIANKGPARLKFTAPVIVTGIGPKTFYPDQDDENGVTEFAGNIPDSSLGAITIKKGGAGKLVLSAANTFTGGMRFAGGTLELADPSAIALGNYLKYESQATNGAALVKVAYAGPGPNLGNLEVDVNATIDLGTDNTAQIRFGSATGWTADKVLSVTNSSGGGNLYILDTNNVALSQIKSVENPAYQASLDENGLLIFTSPLPTPPSSLSYENINGTVGTAIASVNPTVTGAVDSYFISPELPVGLSLNTSTGLISGTPSTAAASAIYTVAATNAGGNTTATLTVAVVAAGSTYNSWLGAADPSDALLLQYAFGAVSPTQPLPEAYLPRVVVSDGSLVLTYYVRQEALGLSVVPELSENLAAVGAGFAPSDTIIKTEHGTISVGGVNLQRRTASVLVETGKPKKFLHLRVTQD